MSIDVKQDGRGIWYAQPYLGKAADGKQIRPRRSFPSAASKAEAQALADAWYASLTIDGKVESALIQDMLLRYIDDRAAKGIALNTQKRWRLYTRTYVGCYLKGAVASELSVMDLNDFEQRLLAPKARGGQGLSRNTVIGVHHFLRGAYRYWVRAGICQTNPMLDVQKPTEDRHEAVSLDEWDFAALDAALSKSCDLEAEELTPESVYSFAAWLALHTGLRVGEVCGLRRRDVSARMSYIHVGGKVVENVGGGVTRDDVTKGRRSRNVTIVPDELAAIRRLVAKQDAQRRSFSPDSALVSLDGSFMHPTTVSRAFSRLRDSLKLPKACTFHSLRHTHATWCLANGVDLKTLSERLGHADEATTLRLYAHLLPGRDAFAAQAFNEFADSLKGGVNGV